MQTIQHATNLPYIPQYTMWNYAMEHPVLFTIIACVISLSVVLTVAIISTEVSMYCWNKNLNKGE